MLFILFCNNYIGAQSKKKSFESISKPRLIDASSQKVLNHIKNTGVKKSQFIQFNDQIDENGEITFSLPEDSKTQITMPISNVNFTDENNYHLYANSEEGNISLIVTDGLYGGSIEFKGVAYTIYSIKKKISIITENDRVQPTRVSNDLKCGMQEKYERPKDAERSSMMCNADCGQAIIDLLVLVSVEATSWLNTEIGIAGRDAWLNQQISLANTALFNSGLSNKMFNFKFIYLPSNPFSLTTKIGDDMITMGNDQTIAAYRSNHQADVVVLLTKNNYTALPSLSNRILGTSHNLDPSNFSKFAIAEVDFIDSRQHTLTHEVAHLIGCHHHDDGTTCARGTFFLDLNFESFGTLMVASAVSNGRVNYFSTPNVTFNGASIGSSDRNNAGNLNSHFCEVANMLDGNFRVDLNGQQCINTSYFTGSTFQGNNLGTPYGVGPYIYTWSYAYTSGGPWFNFGTNSNYASFSNQGGCSPKYIRARVTSSDGYIVSKIKFINCSGCYHSISDELELRSTTSKKNNLDYQEVISIYPNPSLRMFEIQSEVTVSSYRIYGIDGRRIQELNNIHKNIFSIDMTNRSKGIYLLELYLSNNEKITKKIILGDE